MMESSSLKETKDFKELKEKKDELKLNLTSLIDLENQFEEQTFKLDEIAKMIDDAKSTIDDLSKLKLEDTQEYVAKSTKTHNTICVQCKNTCHERCGLDEITVQGHLNLCNCVAFQNSNTCLNCHHSFEHHVHLRVVYEQVIRKNKLFEENLAKIASLKDECQKKEMMRNLVADKIGVLNLKIDEVNTKTFDYIKQLKSICSKFDYYTEIKSIHNMILDQLQAQQKKYSETKSDIDHSKILTLESIKMKYSRIMKTLIKEENI